jgi:hypothetical protein
MADPKCSYCGGVGEVYGVFGDVKFRLVCCCSGGSEESVRWLLRLYKEVAPGEDYVI